MKFLSSATAATLALLFASGCATTPRTSDKPTTVARVDLKRYAGTWHEIARFPNWFQRDCAGNVTATYTPKSDGTIQVDNRCLDKNGDTKQSVGTARVVDGSNGSRLKVSFFWPFSGDYWVLALDEANYDWALVGTPSRDFLWVLARGKKLPDATYDRIVAIAAEKGFDVSKLEKTPQR